MNHRSITAILLICFAPALALAETGVSDERVSLPDGPGSIGGVGENISVNQNMGVMSYSIPIDVPPGIATATPSLALSYGSGAGGAIAGLGWSLDVGSIERMTVRGLPEYTEDDEFAADGGSELVRTGLLESTAVYRARFERGMVRYRWHARGTGRGGYWTAERPDGSIAYFGADETGVEVATARAMNASGGVFRYCLVATVDTYGNVVRYRYRKSGEQPLLVEVGYGYGRGAVARFTIQLDYVPREDVISTGAPGFLLETRERLIEVRVRSGSEVIRSWRLEYEPIETSGGLSRLLRVRRFGRGGLEHPATQSFTYSRSLAGVCEGGACSGPFMVDMGTLPGGVDMQSGRATLLDINGDALPDVLSSTDTGVHTFSIARVDRATGQPRFDPTAITSAATPAAGSPFVLGVPNVQVIDVDGDGHTDIVSSRVPAVLCNEGTGDWGGSSCLMDAELPELDADDDDTGDANPQHVRFFDYDNDKRIDMIRTVDALTTEVHVNTTTGFEPRAVQPIEMQFDESLLQLADMNGDGLQDPVVARPGARISYRLNLGFGRWSPWIDASVPGLGDERQAQFQDLDGDGLADVVVVSGAEVHIARNRSSGTFEVMRRITSADVEGDIPERISTTTVLFADMNGSGSDDVVWITSSGHVQYLELFAVRPNLLSRIENGLGGVQDVEYGTSVTQQAFDDVAWTHPLPHPMNLVVATDVWERLTGGEDGAGLHERVELSYRDGFYDGRDRAFRGFAFVTERSVSTSTLDGQEEGTVLYDFEVGATDPYRHGLLVRKRMLGGTELRPIQEMRTEYEDCPLADVPTSGPGLRVRYVCSIADVLIAQEGRPEGEWATTRTERTYDGYGQVTRLAKRGVVHRGSPESPTVCGACDEGGPCGAECAGDEETTDTTYIDPDASTSGRWLIGRAVRVRRSGDGSGLATETVTRYDGDAFVGLPEGQLTRGSATSVQERVTTDRLIAKERSRYDEFGNLVETIDPNGSVADDTTHRRVYTYDERGLRIVRMEILTADGDATPYRLRRDVAYETSFLEPSEATAWMVVQGGTPATPRDPTRYLYDEHGRAEAIVSPGDSDAAPTVEYAYELASPSSRIVIRRRTATGGAFDLEQAECLDGLGRTVQKRTRLDASSVEVTGFTVRNRRGQDVRRYQPYRATTLDCEMAEPAGVRFTELRYDPADRLVEQTEPDEDLYGSASVTRMEYAPLSRISYDEEDGSGGRFEGTPTVLHLDGLDRITGVDRLLSADMRGRYGLRYDALGRLVEVHDPEGNVHGQDYDLLGRVVAIDDPNSGRTTLVYDDAGNTTERTDARGVVSRTAYDGANRPTAIWDASDEAGTRVETVYDLDPTCEDCDRGAGREVSTTYPLGDLGAGRDETSYDPRGRIRTLARTLAGYRFEWGYEYDNADRAIAVVEPDGTRLDQTLDAGARVIAVDGIIDAVRYDERAQLAAIEHANGARTTYGYDARMRISEIRTFGAGDAILQGFDYQRDRTGKLLSIEDRASAPERPSAAAQIEHDAWGRLTRVSYGDETLDFTYDLLDNLLSSTSSLGATSRAHVGPMTYDASRPNALTSAGSIAYQYDAAGNVSRRGDRDYRWDHRGRLTEVTGGTGAAGRFYYSENAGRVAKREGASLTLYLTPNFEVRDGISQTYVRVDKRRVARVRSATLQTALYTDVAPLGEPNDQIDAADAWVAHASERGFVAPVGEASDPAALLMAAARRQLFDASDRVTALHHDHLGSLTLATDRNGERRGERQFHPYGQVRYRQGFVDEAAFTGQELDASTSFYAFEYRHLDSASGRWASVDPAFASLTTDSAQKLGQSTTAYAYVSNDPIDNIDPLGLADTPAAAPAGGAAPAAKGEAAAVDGTKASATIGTLANVAHDAAAGAHSAYSAAASGSGMFGKALARVTGALGGVAAAGKAIVTAAATGILGYAASKGINWAANKLAARFPQHATKIQAANHGIRAGIFGALTVKNALLFTGAIGLSIATGGAALPVIMAVAAGVAMLASTYTTGAHMAHSYAAARGRPL